MSQGSACQHKPRPEHVVVTMRRHNRSAFNGYRWTPSDYSEVRCLTCDTRWRTKAAWVNRCRDATEAERVLPISHLTHPVGLLESPVP